MKKILKDNKGKPILWVDGIGESKLSTLRKWCPKCQALHRERMRRIREMIVNKTNRVVGPYPYCIEHLPKLVKRRFGYGFTRRRWKQSRHARNHNKTY